MHVDKLTENGQIDAQRTQIELSFTKLMHEYIANVLTGKKDKLAFFKLTSCHLFTGQ